NNGGFMVKDLTNGKPIVKIRLESSQPDVVFKNITVENLTVNGKRIGKEDCEISTVNSEEIKFVR
ncbi:MAG: hypothetical protein MJ072_06460, partial [Clostridia bacterium]|nr:hypothetical protein [Clostridia bacterium]